MRSKGRCSSILQDSRCINRMLRFTDLALCRLEDYFPRCEHSAYPQVDHDPEMASGLQRLDRFIPVTPLTCSAATSLPAPTDTTTYSSRLGLTSRHRRTNANDTSSSMARIEFGSADQDLAPGFAYQPGCGIRSSDKEPTAPMLNMGKPRSNLVWPTQASRPNQHLLQYR